MDSELLVVFGEVVARDAEGAAVQLGGVSPLLVAFFELDVLVPERMVLKVKTDRLGAALEETILSV